MLAAIHAIQTVVGAHHGPGPRRFYRNLKTFEVSLETSRSLAEKIPDQFLKVSESGISDPNSIKELIEFGYKGFLIGENFMKSDHPGNTAKDFIKKITQ